MDKSLDRYLLIGNPGAGKSTILNGLCKSAGVEHAKFHAGISLGGGLTTKFNWFQVPGFGVFMDTPGLDDDTMRKEAAAQIKKALTQEGRYRIFFICFAQSGRIQPADKTTIKLVCDACKDVPGFCYNVIFNKMSTKIIQTLMTDVKALNLFAGTLFDGIEPGPLDFIENDPNLEDVDTEQSSKLTWAVPPKIKDFMMGAQYVTIPGCKVQDVRTDAFAKEREAMESRLKELKDSEEKQKEAMEQMKGKIEAAAARTQKMRQDFVNERERLLQEQKRRDSEHSKKISKLVEEQKETTRKMQNKFEEAQKAHKEDIAKQNALRKQHEEDMKRNIEEHERQMAEAKTAREKDAKRLEEMEEEAKQSRKREEASRKRFEEQEQAAKKRRVESEKQGGSGTGAGIGAAIGTAIAPGIGTLLGSLIGGLCDKKS